jgi:pantetheine-phosphate adenylyltransferase
MNKAVYPGSFDPITVGHVDIINRISRIYDEVTILVSESPSKTYLFTAAERMSMIEKSLPNIKNVKIATFDGLTVEYVRRHKAKVIVRGLRAVTDFEYEMAMASMNRKLAPEIETVLAFASPEYYYISSRAIKEIARYGGALDGLVPNQVAPLLQRKISEKHK